VDRVRLPAGLASPNPARKHSSIMKKDDIKIGATYTAKVSDRVVPIRIDRENSRGGWDATNLVTNKQIRIKSAQCLRGEAGSKGGAAAKSEAKVEKATKPAEPEVTPPAETPRKEAKAPRTKAPRTPKEHKEKKLSCLDAAAQVLKEAGEPLQCKAMIDAMSAASSGRATRPRPPPRSIAPSSGRSRRRDRSRASRRPSAGISLSTPEPRRTDP
jgi:hypothetical protein